MEPADRAEPCAVGETKVPLGTDALLQSGGEPGLWSGEPTDHPETSEDQDTGTEPDVATNQVSAPLSVEIEARMRPGAMSPIGFLGLDESLLDTIDGDAATVNGLSLTHEALADALEGLLTQVLELFRRRVQPEEIPRALTRQTTFPSLGRPESIPHFDLNNMPNPEWGFLVGDLQVFVVSYKNMQGCPWGDTVTGNTDFMIFNRETGEWVIAPEIMPHLIRAHRFFGGRGTAYRTDPERLAKVFGF